MIGHVVRQIASVVDEQPPGEPEYDMERRESMKQIYPLRDRPKIRRSSFLLAQPPFPRSRGSEYRDNHEVVYELQVGPMDD
jgi:hypothetical protein